MNRNTQQATQVGSNALLQLNVVSAAPRLSATVESVQPEFIRLPKTGSLCPRTGLSRSKLNELILPSPLNRFRPPVRSISLRNRGQVKAVRLVVFDSLMSYLRQLEAEQFSAALPEGYELPNTFPATSMPPLDADRNRSAAEQTWEHSVSQHRAGSPATNSRGA